jgi:hypothetical protein
MAREMTTDQVREFLGHHTRTAKVATVPGRANAPLLS